MVVLTTVMVDVEVDVMVLEITTPVVAVLVIVSVSVDALVVNMVETLVRVTPGAVTLRKCHCKPQHSSYRGLTTL